MRMKKPSKIEILVSYIRLRRLVAYLMNLSSLEIVMIVAAAMSPTVASFHNLLFEHLIYAVRYLFGI